MIKEIFEIEPKLTFRKNENTVDIRMFRKDLFNFLIREVGLKSSPKFERMIIPKKYLNKKLELKIIKGLFDTDGHVSITKNNGILYPRLELKISKSPVQKQVIEILKNNNFNIKTEVLSTKLMRLRLNGRNELIKWMNKIGTSNERHLEKINQINLARAGFEPATFNQTLLPNIFRVSRQ